MSSTISRFYQFLDSFKAIVRRTTLKSYRLCSLPVSFSRFTWNFLKPSVDAPPRSPTDDTEFSAQHARRVIGSGVVLERKASISAGPVPELKNKVHSACSNELSFTNPGMEVRIPLYCVFGLGCVEVEVFVFKKLVSLRLACFFGGAVSIFGGRCCGNDLGGSNIGACSQVTGGARSFEAEARYRETGHGLHRDPHHVQGGEEIVSLFFVCAVGKMLFQDLYRI